MQQRTSVVKEY